MLKRRFARGVATGGEEVATVGLAAGAMEPRRRPHLAQLAADASFEA
jgi:hypothetical protein